MGHCTKPLCGLAPQRLFDRSELFICGTGNAVPSSFKLAGLLVNIFWYLLPISAFIFDSLCKSLPAENWKKAFKSLEFS